MTAYDPFVSTNPVVSALEQHRGNVERTRENSARYAQGFASYSTTGVGEYEPPDSLAFGCTFTEQPFVSYGFTVVTQDLVVGSFPRCSGGVHGWIKNNRNFYIGAFVFFTVDIPTAGLPPAYTIEHHFTFTAVALKDLPAHLLD